MKQHSKHISSGEAAYLDGAIVRTPDFPKKGVTFLDVLPALRDPHLFASIVVGLCEPYRALGGGSSQGGPDVVVGLEARGFIFGTAVARNLRVGFVPIRKAGKLPGCTDRLSYSLEYGEAVIEMQKGILEPGSRVLIVDDLLATGGTAAAAGHLVNNQGARVIGYSFVIELDDLNGRKFIMDQHPKTPTINSLLSY